MSAQAGEDAELAAERERASKERELYAAKAQALTEKQAAERLAAKERADAAAAAEVARRALEAQRREDLDRGINMQASSSHSLCLECGFIGKPAIRTPGHWVVTLILLCFFLIPGIFYFLWRHSSTYRTCSKCESRTIVPLTSPRGREHCAKNNITLF